MTLARLAAAATLSLTLFTAPVHAAAITFVGADSESPVGGPNPNSTAAEASFLASAAAHGATTTETFSSVALGFGPRTLAGGASLTITGADIPDESGVNLSDPSLNNLLGYDIGDGTGRWLGFPDGGSATFTFARLQYSFGFYTTGTRASLNPTFTVSDGANSFVVVSNDLGGASYFGYIDPVGFHSVTITSAVGEDLWGIDNVSYNTAVPEPATWVLMIGGVGLVGATFRRRKSQPVLA